MYIKSAGFVSCDRLSTMSRMVGEMIFDPSLRRATVLICS